MSTPRYDDPRKLRTLLGRVSALAREHSVPSVFVGLAAPEGDLSFPDLVDFIQAALRVEDGIFRMTRERVILHLADVEPERAREVVSRVVSDFRAQYPSVDGASLETGFFAVPPGVEELRARDVLPEIFAPATVH
jgi:hypothetical protein